MAATTTIRTNVLKALRLDSANSTMQDRALHWMNKALDKIQAYVPQAEFMKKSERTITTVASQATYALPTDFIKMLSLRDDTNQTIIDPVIREEFDRRHPDPSSESTGKPYEYTLEYDNTQDPGLHYMRLALIPDSAYMLYAVMQVWHPDLSAVQNPAYTKLETAIEDMAIAEGCMEVYAEPEFAQLRQEFKLSAQDSVRLVERIFNSQTTIPRNIITRMRRPTNARSEIW